MNFQTDGIYSNSLRTILTSAFYDLNLTNSEWRDWLNQTDELALIDYRFLVEAPLSLPSGSKINDEIIELDPESYESLILTEIRNNNRFRKAIQLKLNRTNELPKLDFLSLEGSVIITLINGVYPDINNYEVLREASFHIAYRIATLKNTDYGNSNYKEEQYIFLLNHLQSLMDVLNPEYLLKGSSTLGVDQITEVPSWFILRLKYIYAILCDSNSGLEYTVPPMMEPSVMLVIWKYWCVYLFTVWQNNCAQIKQIE